MYTRHSDSDLSSCCTDSTVSFIQNKSPMRSCVACWGVTSSSICSERLCSVAGEMQDSIHLSTFNIMVDEISMNRCGKLFTFKVPTLKDH